MNGIFVGKIFSRRNGSFATNKHFFGGNSMNCQYIDDRFGFFFSLQIIPFLGSRWSVEWRLNVDVIQTFTLFILIGAVPELVQTFDMHFYCVHCIPAE